MASKMVEKRPGTLAGTKAKGRTVAGPQYAPAAGGPGAGDAWRLLDGARYAGYWLVGLVLLPGASMAGRRLWAADSTARVAVSLVLVLAGSLLCRALWEESRPRGNRWDPIRVVVSVGWLFAVMLGTSWLGGPGPWTVARPWADVMLGGGALLALWWTAGALPAVAGRGHDAHPQQADTLAEALGLGGSVVTSAEHDDKGIRSAFRFRLLGVSADALRAAAPLLAVRMRIPATGIRVIEDPNDASAPTMIVVREDVLNRMPPWPGPSRPGGSITEPVRSGLYEDGSEIEAVRYGRHKLVGGMTGAGKTESEIAEVADMMTRRDVVFMWADAVKPGQTVPDFAPGLCRVATTKPQVRKLVLGLIAAVEYRATLPVGRMWKPTPQLPAIDVHFEEGAVLQQLLGADLLDFVATARSVGITITWSMQRPSSESLNTDVRAQFADRACYGVAKDDDADMVLNEATLEAGARPQVWKDERPGYHYREAGTDKRKHSMPARAWLIPVRALHQHVAEWAPRMCGGAGAEALDAGTAEAMGDAWTELKSGTRYAVEHGWIAPTATAPAWVPPTGRGDDDEDGDEPGAPETGGPSGPSTPAAPEPAGPTAGGTVPPWGTSEGDAMRDETGDGERDETGPGAGVEDNERSTGRPSPYAAPVPRQPAAPAGERDSDPASAQDDDEGEDGMTAAERIEFNDEVTKLRAEMVEALGDIDPEIATALRDADGEGVIDVSDVPEFELWTGEDEPNQLDYAGRVAAVAAEIERRLPGGDGGAAVSVTDLADVLTELPGWSTAAKPAVYRLLDKGRADGQVEDREHGSWWVEATFPAWLRRNVARLQDTEGEDGEGSDG